MPLTRPSTEDDALSTEDELQGLSELKIDPENLYREEVYTDLRIATIRRLVPIKADGSPDETRQALFTGQTNLMSQAGPLPVECPIDAVDLTEATAKFPAAIQKAVEQLMEEAKEIRRREASRIVVPSGVPPGGLGGGSGGGGIIGGGL
jgi:hypothetical protein